MTETTRGTSLRPLLPWLLMAAALSVTMMILGAGRGDRMLPALSAGLLIALVAGTGLGLNAPLWSAKAAITAADVRSAVRCNSWLAALIYAWGASALLGVYSLAEIWWQHAFQYASGAIVFALILSYIGWRLGRDKTAAVPSLGLTFAHGGAALGGLIFLISSGKLATTKPDWAANEVFLWGGLGVVALCAMSALTQTRKTVEPPTNDA